MPNPQPLYSFGPFQFDPETGTLSRPGQTVTLPPKAGAVLIVLLENAGRVVSADELRQRAWGVVAVAENSVAFQIHGIRKAVGRDADGRYLVENLPRRGYRISVPVTRIAIDMHPPPGLATSPGSFGNRSDVSPFRRDGSAGDSKDRADSANAATLGLTERGRRRWVVPAGVGAVVLSSAIMVAAALDRTATEDLRISRYVALTHDALSKATTTLVDDEWVYYADGAGRFLRIPTHGGESAAVFEQPRAFELQDESLRDGAYLAIRANGVGPGAGELWILPSHDGIPHHLGSTKCEGARWSLDGSRVACSVVDGLTILRADGTVVGRVPTPADGNIGHPQFSPDGRRVRFDLDVPGDRTAPTYSIWDVNVDGTNLHEVLPRGSDITSACCGTWVLGGEVFVFQTKEAGQSNLWAVSERRGLFSSGAPDPVRLTSGPIGYEAPTVSRDGGMVFAVGRPMYGEMMRFDTASGNFEPYLHGLSATSTSFSPDRKSIAYISYPDEALWRSRADGSEPQRLTLPAPEADGVAWSPDGRRLAFRSRMSSSHMKIYIIAADGGDPVPITSDDSEQGFPTWSADSTQLVFGEVPAHWQHPLGTEALHMYTLATRAVSTVPGSAGLWTSRWSPDGRYIAALTIIGQQLRVFDTAVGTWRAVPVGSLENPVWSHDGRFIYAGAVTPERASIRRVRMLDGAVEHIVGLEGYALAFPAWFGLTPDDSILVLHSRGGPEIYALTLERR